MLILRRTLTQTDMQCTYLKGQYMRSLLSLNTQFSPMRVFPVPGGPKSRSPLGGPLRPVKMSGLFRGRTTISCTWFRLDFGRMEQIFTVFLANSNPAMSSHFTGSPWSMISFLTISTILLSMFLYLSETWYDNKRNISCQMSKS